jgi:hypothetical protein
MCWRWQHLQVETSITSYQSTWHNIPEDLCHKFKVFYVRILTVFAVLTRRKIQLHRIYVRHPAVLYRHIKETNGQSQWTRGLRRGSAAARFWDFGFEFRWLHECLSLVTCCVWCDGLITRKEESYQALCFWMWSWSLDNEKALANWGAVNSRGVGEGKKSPPSIRLLFYESSANYMTQATRFDRSCSLGLHHNFCFWRDSPQWGRASSFTRIHRSRTTTHHSR